MARDGLFDALIRLDGKSYGGYKSLRGLDFALGPCALTLEYVQGDPFASPSRIVVRVPREVARLPGWCVQSAERAIAARDFIARSVHRHTSGAHRRLGSGKSGLLAIDPPGQAILERTSVLFTPDAIEVRLVVGLPANGRRIAGRAAARLLCEDVLDVIMASVPFDALDEDSLREHVEVFEDSRWLRARLGEANLVAFVRDGARLPRAAGDDDSPLQTAGVVPFRSPDELRVCFDLPNGGAVEGMGIPRGVTAIVGGGYHGKSTLLDAIARGVYDHIPGDGRELVVCDVGAVKVRAEDGRPVAGVDISPFIATLPGGLDTSNFSTRDASGSTSQAASIMESIEVGATALLMDEDTCATNFMIRDARMQRLIAAQDEPITPFIDRVRDLYESLGVSTLLVIGGCGDYFEVADTVVAMRAFKARDVTGEARAVVEEITTSRAWERVDALEEERIRDRILDAGSIDPSRGRRPVKLSVHGTWRASFGEMEIDLSGAEQLLCEAQSRAVLEAMVWCKARLERERGLPLLALLDALEEEVFERGLLSISQHPRGDLVGFRRFELAMALNRLRTLRVRQVV